MDSGLEVNHFVKVRTICVCVYRVELGYMLRHVCMWVCMCVWHVYMKCMGIDFSIAVQCDTLNNPTNGEVSAEGNTFGSQANYSCSEGYVLNGISTRMCQADGQWSGSEPLCEGENSTVCDVCIC